MIEYFLQEIPIRSLSIEMEGVIVIVVVVIIAAIISIAVSVRVYKNKKYKKTTYYQITKYPYSSLKYDKGKFGEYVTYKNLQSFESAGGKFLFNVYIPKANNEMTEVDILLICSKGLFVFESKNYSGWIFGNEAHKNWTQTLPQGGGRSHKERFYNPIMQNASHIKHLRRLVGENLPVRSIIVFSERCTLKDITIRSKDVSVVKCNNVLAAVKKICGKTEADHLTQMEINDIYNKLYPYTQVSYEEREQHTNNIRMY